MLFCVCAASEIGTRSSSLVVGAWAEKNGTPGMKVDIPRVCA